MERWLGLLAVIVSVVSLWVIFTKAGRPGWACLVPLYNVYVLLKVVGRSGWWMLLLFIPLINIAVGVWIQISLAQRFGKPWPFGLGLLFLPFVFLPILAFGDAVYEPSTT